MELRQLRYFQAVARFGSFTAASKVLFIAQPALSLQISKLESELGCVLFERGARGTRLTAAGDEMLRRAPSILQSIDSLPDVVRAASKERVVVRLGVPPLVSRFLTVPLISALRKRFPSISLRVHEVMTGTLREMISNGSIDLALLHTLAPDEFPNARRLLSESLLVCGALNNPYFEGAAIDIAALEDIPLIVTTAKNSHRQVLETLALQNGFALNIVAEVDSLSRIYEMVMEGLGAIVTSPTGLAGWSSEELQSARLRGTEDAWHTNLVIAEGRAGSGSVNDVAELVAEILARHPATSTYPAPDQSR